MNISVKLSVVAIFFFSLIAGQADTPEKETVVEQPSVKTTEPWEIKVGAPGWLANVSGFTGFHGVNPYANVGIGQILKHTNFIFSFGGEAEVRKGRFGVLGDLLYLDAQAGVSGKDLVSRTGLGLQLFIGEFFGSYRLIQGPCGWLDLLAGFRSTYVGQQAGLNANEPAIDAASIRHRENLGKDVDLVGIAQPHLRKALAGRGSLWELHWSPQHSCIFRAALAGCQNCAYLTDGDGFGSAIHPVHLTRRRHCRHDRPQKDFVRSSTLACLHRHRAGCSVDDSSA
jgi:hypothetical protein